MKKKKSEFCGPILLHIFYTSVHLHSTTLLETPALHSMQEVPTEKNLFVRGSGEYLM